ncbi:MAG: hypothetical protein E7005_02795 [Alphaproteobacteria bacterium]|nr:hypothetical protein [Alphaproteobacteria bacterium]
MLKFFLGCLSLVAIGLMINQAIAGGQNPANNSGIMIVETISSSSVVSPQESDMEPLPGNPGVEVAPIEGSSAVEPVMVEEDMEIDEVEDGE